jgi:chemotaxis protein methyltransferase CheR
MRARRGVYPLEVMHKYAEAYRRAGGERDFSRYYVADDELALMTAGLRRNIVFSQHSLASDGSFNEFNVIFCRNVMIYFGGDLKDRVQQLLYDSLCRFGFLCLGKKESLEHSPLESRFEALAGDLRIYRRIA